jgi:hypothetical protein
VTVERVACIVRESITTCHGPAYERGSTPSRVLATAVILDVGALSRLFSATILTLVAFEGFALSSVDEMFTRGKCPRVEISTEAVPGFLD